MTNQNPNRETTNPGNCQFCGNALAVPRHIANKTCDECRASYQHKYDEVNKEARRLKNARLYQQNREKYILYAKERWASFSKEEKRHFHRRYALKRRFGLSMQEYDALLQKQNGGCAVCGKKPTGKRLFPIDHDHSCCPNRESVCGKCIRGILCDRCNLLVGFLENNKDLIPKCEAYLAKANAHA